MNDGREMFVGDRFQRLLRLARAVSACPLAGLALFEGDLAHVLVDGPADPPSTLPARRLTLQKPRMVTATGGMQPAEAQIFGAAVRVGALCALPLGEPSFSRGLLVVADDVGRDDLEHRLDSLTDLKELFEEAIEKHDDVRLASTPGAARPAGLSNRQAGLDSVTGLPLRSFALAECERLVERSAVLGSRFGVAIVSIDRFRRVNESLGPGTGDTLLRQVAERLRENVEEGDFVGRRSGDEYVIVVRNLPNAHSVMLAADRIQQAVRDPFNVQHGNELLITASVGIAVFPDHAEDAAGLLRSADVALARSKQRGQGFITVFDSKMLDAARDRLELEKDLRAALGQGGLSLHYQPKYWIRDGKRLVGCEALMRWTHPTKGPISPARFIPVAEESGLIVPMGAWALGEACRQRRRWADMGLDVGRVSVNVSALQFARADFAGSVQRSMRPTGIDPSWLELELTESAVMSDVDRAAERLESLRKLGVKVSVDDFGTGYSSLAYLTRLPVDVLKIDRSFVRELDALDERGREAKALAGGIAYLAHALGLEVIAEGVETEGQLESLRELECDAIQGYLFGKPLAPADFERHIGRG